MGSRANKGAWLCCMSVGHGIGIDMGGGVGMGASVGLCCMSVRHGGRIDMGGRVHMGACVGGAFIEEEDGEFWLINRVSIFRRRTSSLVAMEAWVTTKWAMATLRRSRMGFQLSGSTIGAQ